MGLSVGFSQGTRCVQILAGSYGNKRLKERIDTKVNAKPGSSWKLWTEHPSRYKKGQYIAFVAACTLHNLLNASLMSENSPPLLDFEDLTVILSTLLPMIYIHNDSKEQPKFSVGLKTYNEVQHCFLTVGMVYPQDLFVFFLNKSRTAN